jgi:hypothetical protein
MNPQVFVSHASDDKPFVLPFAQRLRDAGIDAWVDKWEIQPGDPLIRRIFEQGIGRADTVIVVLSRSSVVKRWVQEEMDTAAVRRIENQTRVIPVRLDDCDVPVAFQSLRWITITDRDNYDAQFREIVNAIYGVTERPLLGDPPAHITATVRPIPGLSQIDSQVLKWLGDCAMRIEQTIMNMRYSPPDEVISELGLTRAEMKDSLEMLECAGFAEASGCGGGITGHVELTSSGFSEYARQYIERYDQLPNEVAMRIMNHGETNSRAICESLGRPRLLIEHILSLMDDYGYAETVRANGAVLVTEVKVKMKRGVDSDLF